MTEEFENQDQSYERDVEIDSPAEPELAELRESVERLNRERDELKDLLLRKQAEFENFRKRTERERSEFVQFASAELMREILNVLDSFELALRDTGSTPTAQGARQGFEFIYKQLLESLKRFGLELIEARGKPFDPHLHEAVSTEASVESPEGTVLEELRRGYLLHGKMLRPAMVTVAAAPETSPDNPEI